MASFSENLMNLQTLQRVDSNIIEIIDNACQVAIYKYEGKLMKWEETDVEGALFLCRRAFYPFYEFIIVNRMSTTNFIEFLTSDMQINLQEPYLLYKNQSGDIIGAWFYKPEDFHRISKKIQTILLKGASPPKRQGCASESDSLPQNAEAQCQDIMTLLAEAHKEYFKKSKNSQSPENNCEDDNNMETHQEKKSLEKSIPSTEDKHNSNVPKLKKYSSEGNEPVSPRKRFMSTGSFDPDRINYLSRLFSTAQISIPNTEVKEDNVDKEFFHIKTANDSIQKIHSSDMPSPPKHVSFLTHDHSPSSVLNASATNELDNSLSKNYCFSTKGTLQPSLQNNKDWKTTMNGDTDIHFTSIKQALKSRIEENPKVMLKIHEAYVSSLKSLFTNDSC